MGDRYRLAADEGEQVLFHSLHGAQRKQLALSALWRRGLAGVPQARFCHNISPDNPQGDRHFMRQPTKTVRQVLDFLDVAVPLDFQMPTPAHQPVGGALAEAWTQRFRAEKQAAKSTAFW